MAYDFKEIEKKWVGSFSNFDGFKGIDFDSREKKYVLVEFPYPSGDGLHVGHCRSYTALDIIARKRRMQGFNVLYPMGWDAFGLPTENYAIKKGVHPSVITKKNTDMLLSWCAAHPGSCDSDNYLNDVYVIMVREAMGGRGGMEENENKIMRKIARTCFIDKEA